MEEKQEKKVDDILDLGKLNELRSLIIGLNQVELERLQRLMRDPQEFAEEISEWLPYSIRKLIDRGIITVDALSPFIEDAMHKSIQKNPQKLADILFPVMGPAIRKAVSEDMKKLIASVNATLESGLSPKSLKWRFQAMFSKKSFAEIVMANTYVYHVRQVFFIHRETGILLHQEIADENVDLESDMVAGMLSAIRDFVHDSFAGNASSSLDEIQVGELKILIEQGPFAIIAAIVEGQPPSDYRLTIMETVEAVHFNHAIDLEKFKGDTEVFKLSSKFLRNCLIKEKKIKKSSVPWPLLSILFLIICFGSYLLYVRFERKQRLHKFLTELEAIPGYHLTNIEKSGSTTFISGLRDFQAEGYDNLLNLYTLDRSKLVFNFEPYISLETNIVIKRAVEILNPPATTFFDYANGILLMKGTASTDWINLASQDAYKVYGVNSIDISEMNVSKSPDLHWIIPAIQKYCFIFEQNIISLDQQQQIQFDSLLHAATHLVEYNKLYNKEMAIYVISYTNRKSNAEANRVVATKRAEQFVALLKKAGLPENLLEAKVLFEEDVNTKISLRSVCFDVFDKTLK